MVSERTPLLRTTPRSPSTDKSRSTSTSTSTTAPCSPVRASTATLASTSTSASGSTLVYSACSTTSNATSPASSKAKATPAPAPAANVRPRPLKESMSKGRFMLILAGIWSSNFTFAFQSTAIPTLAPTISSAFAHAELASYLGSAFTLGNTAGIPVYGMLSATLGRRFAMLTACAFYGAGTIACALASDMYPLIAARALTGLGGGGLLTVSAVICTDLVDLRVRGWYQGIMMTIFGLGSSLGGPLSGYLSDVWDWRLSFWVQVPSILWCAVVVGTFLPEPVLPPTHTNVWSGLASLDWVGIGLLLGSTSALLGGFSAHTSFFRPWSHISVWGLLTAALVGIVLFIGVEKRVKHPIVPLRLFTPRLAAIWVSGLLLSVASQAFLFHVPSYFAVLLDSTATQAGMVVSVCSGLGLSTGSLFAGYHIRRGGRYTWLAVVSLVPSIIAAFVAAEWSPSWPTWGYYATVLPTSVGYAIFLCVSLIALISSVDSETMPPATALLYTVRSLGTTLGVSVGGSIQVGALVHNLRKHLHLPPAEAEEVIEAVVHSKSAIKSLPPDLRRVALHAYGVSLKAVWVAAGLAAIGALGAAVFIRQNEVVEKRAPEEQEQEQEQDRGRGNGMAGA